MNGIQVFDYKSQQVRTVEKDGEVWFVAKDVCDVLELSDVNKATQHLDDDEKLVRKLFVSGQHRDVITINEPGLYALILKSRKPEAKQFSRWVRHKVIPSIMRHGVYMTDSMTEKILADPDVFIKVLQELKTNAPKSNSLPRRPNRMLRKSFLPKLLRPVGTAFSSVLLQRC